MPKSARLNLDEFVPYRMSVASNAVSGVIATAYEAMFGLKVPEWRIIAVLAEVPNINPLEIGARTRMDKMTVSRAGAALSDRALIERSANPADKRSHLLKLTEKGERLYAGVAPIACDLERALLAGFDKAEIAQFVATLRKLEQAAVSLSAARSD